MRRFVLPLFIALAWVQPMFSQTATFDIATFVPPPGWQHAETPGLLTLQNRRTIQGRTQFCQIFLFASQFGSPNPATNFQHEWDRKVAGPLHFTGRPSAQAETNAEGWTSFTDHADAMSQGTPIRVILLTATKSARFVSIVVSVSPNSYQQELVNFFQNLNFHDPGRTPLNPSSPAANPDPSDPGAAANPMRPEIVPLAARFRTTFSWRRRGGLARISPIASRWFLPGEDSPMEKVVRSICFLSNRVRPTLPMWRWARFARSFTPIPLAPIPLPLDRWRRAFLQEVGNIFRSRSL